MKADRPVSIKEKLFQFCVTKIFAVGAPLQRRTGGAAAAPYQR
jgi:hypothetical protein